MEPSLANVNVQIALRFIKLIVSISQTLEDRDGAGTASASLNARLDEMEQEYAAEQKELFQEALDKAEETAEEIRRSKVETRFINAACRTADSIRGAHMTQCEWKNKKDAEDEASSYVQMEAAYNEVRQAQYRLDRDMLCAAKSWQSYQEVYPGEEGRVKAQLIEWNMPKEAIDSLMESLAEISMGVQEDGGQEGSSATVVPGATRTSSHTYY